MTATVGANLMTAPASAFDAGSAIQHRKRLDAPPKADVMGGMRAAVAAHRGNGWIKNLWQASRGPGGLTIDEFFYYRLYEADLAQDAIARYVGKSVQQRLHDACNSRDWFAVADDKALFYTAARGAGLPVPQTVAIYDPKARAGFARTLRDAKALRDFLATNADWPLFAKPVDGMYSVGAIHMLERAEQGIRVKGGAVEPIDAIADFIVGLSPAGFLFQRVLAPHADLATRFGHTVGSVRLLVTWGSDAPALESAVVKIPAEANVADNYWRQGNMLGALDRETGEVRRAITGLGLNLAEVDTHPDTGAAIRGTRVPRWQEVVDTCLEAARMCPAIRTQSWDVAVTDAGPVLLEFNFGGDLNLHQLAHRRGALTPSYVEHLRRCGYKGKLP